jgi:ABC-2 type transport system permease protein
MGSVLLAESTKLRTLRSTMALLMVTVVVSAALAALVGASFNANFAHLPGDQQSRFDPLFATFYGLTIGQLTLVVFGVLAVTGEYSSATMSATLVAVPRRGQLYCAKAITVAGWALATALVTVAVTFPVAQLALGPHRTDVGATSVLAATLGATVYLMLICLFATGVAAILRSSVTTLAVLLPLLFLGSQGLGNVPKLKVVTQYFPDQVGQVALHLTGPPGDPRFGRPYGAWAGLGILALWTGLALVGGYLAFRRRDS